jgi:2-haloacid dehalogenase
MLQAAQGGSKMPRLSDYQVLTFDCYGTLIDWETGIVRAIGPWLEGQGVSATRDQILAAFAAAEAPQQAQTPDLRYPDLLARVHAALAKRFGVASDTAAAQAFGRSIPEWPPFPDSADALAYLKQHYRLVILSNVDRASFAHSARKLGVEFDAVYTAEDVGSYKPDVRNFEYMLARLAEQGIAREQILHTAQSLYHDHISASRFGLATCWIHRRAGQAGHGATRPPEVEVSPDFRFASLGAMADAHRGERRS